MFGVEGRAPGALGSMVVYRFFCGGCRSRYIGGNGRRFFAGMGENAESDKNSHIFKHFGTSPSCGGRCSLSCFGVLDSTDSSIDLGLRGAFCMDKIKPELGRRLQHYGTFLAF